MAEEIIEVTTRPDGKAEMRVEGIPGMSFLAAAGDLARLLGGEIEEQELTAEAYQDAGEQQQCRPRLGASLSIGHGHQAAVRIQGTPLLP
jgi:hypothetical protein